MIRVVAAILMFGLPALPAIVHADECFCLIHGSDAILRGCEAYKAATDFYSTAVCTDPVTGKQSEQTIYSDWKRIEAGTDRCAPCKRAPRGTAKEPPRGNEGTQQ